MDTLSLKPQIDLFEQSMSELELLLRSANIFEQIGDRESNPSPDDILVKTAKGISFVFLFSAYEQLLKGTVRAVLETANSYRGKLKNMQDGFIAAALNSSFRSYADASNVKTKIGNARDVRSLLDSYVRDLKFTDYFPDDGSYMKSTQVRTICYLIWGTPRQFWEELGVISMTSNTKEMKSPMAQSCLRKLAKTILL